ncbi:uncharacterized protein LOC132197846 [Neocloeon triangulifer]|uniref:uncharacterized protein LOC132197846 n=1 Tax=Neocloeon triangulifer TaxID=2078957 RepID=UPI00286FA287|nr:uncharacterized protein LOC132197846 [Neocloeon triangulifer]
MTMEKIQKSAQSKKEFRLQNRKRKLEAFFNIALANDKQRQANKPPAGPPKKKRKKLQNNRGNRDLIKKEIIEVMNAAKIKNGAIAERKEQLTGEEYKKLKQSLSERKKFLKDQPRFWLRENGKAASLEVPPANRIPLLLGDVQQLVLFGLVGNHVFQDHNRWCHLDRHGKVSQVVVVILEGVGYGSLLNLPVGKSAHKSFEETFPDAVELVESETYNRNIVDDFSLVPLSTRSCRAIFLNYGSREAEMKSKMFRTAFPVGVVKTTVTLDIAQEVKEPRTALALPPPLPPPPPPKVSVLPPTDKFSRVQLLLSPSQMLEENFPMPLGEMAYRYGHYVMTKDKYAEITPSSPMFGLDCEMCMTTSRLNELTRVSIVNEKHELVYETLVMPYNKIINYLTRFSGITKQMMVGVKTRLADVQRDIRALLPPDAILVGQSLNSDLHAMQMFHPYCIDSSVVFNLHGVRKRKTKLKTLYETFLGGKIQDGFGHDSVEDAASALKLIQFKLTKSLEFGDSVLGFDLKHFEEEKLGVEKAKKEMLRIEEEEKEDEKLEAEEQEVHYKTVDIDVPQPEVLRVMEASSLFTIAGKKKKVGVFSTPKVMEMYQKYTEHPLESVQDVIKPGSHGYTSESNYKVVKNTCRNVEKFDLVVTHLQVSTDSEKERARVVNSCLKVANGMKDNAMMVVIAGGAKTQEGLEPLPDSRPGCFIKIKLATFQKI